MTAETALYARWRQTRDSEAFREIVERHLGMVYATAHRILATNEDAEEVAQECFEQLALEKTAVRENLAGWLYRTAANRALDRVRSESARKARERRYAENRAQAQDPSWDDIYAYVDDAITALPEELRAAIVLRYFEGHTHEAAATALGVSPNTVMNRVKRGVEEIRRRLGEQGIVAGASLAAALTGIESEAAPLALTASVNKIALAGWAGAGATTYMSTIVAGALIMKNTIVGVSVALAIVAVGLGIYASRETASKQAAATSQQKEAAVTANAATADSAPKPAAAPEKKPIEANTPPPDKRPDEEALKPNKARVAGVLLDAHGAPLAGYTIAGVRLGDRAEHGMDYAHTGDNGAFTLNNIEPGRYWLTTTGSRRPSRQFPPPQGDTTVVSLTAGESKTGVVLHFSEGLSISGHIVDEKGKAIDAAEVMAQADEELPWIERYPILAEAAEQVQGELANMLSLRTVRTQTAKDGRFVLVNVVENNYNVAFAKTGYRQVNRPIEAGASGVEVVLEKLKITVSGQVVDSVKGHPLPKAQLCLYPAWPGSAGAISSDVHFDKTADANGRFTVTDENAMGIGFVIARADGHLAEGVNLREMSVSEDGQIKDVAVALRPSRKARGTVLTDHGSVLAKVNLFLGNPPNPDFSTFANVSIGITDRSGAFEVTIPSGEECTVSAATQELGKKSKKYYVGDSAMVPAGTADVDGIILTLSENGASITGALAIDGKPVPRVRVVAQAVTPDFNMYGGFDGKSDDAGQYTVAGLPSMAYRVEVLSHICPGFGPYAAPLGQRYKVTGVSREVALERQQNVTADLDFVSGASEIAGRMHPLGDAPGAALWFGLEITRGGGITQIYMLDTEADGSFHAAGLPEGDVKWRTVYVQGNKVYRWGGTLHLGAAESVALTPELREENQVPTNW